MKQMGATEVMRSGPVYILKIDPTRYVCVCVCLCVCVYIYIYICTHLKYNSWLHWVFIAALGLL